MIAGVEGVTFAFLFCSMRCDLFLWSSDGGGGGGGGDDD